MSSTLAINCAWRNTSIAKKSAHSKVLATIGLWAKCLIEGNEQDSTVKKTLFYQFFQKFVRTSLDMAFWYDFILNVQRIIG